MDNEQSLNHTKWECKYHVVWIPKYRRRELYGKLRLPSGKVSEKIIGYETTLERRMHRVIENLGRLQSG